MKILVSALAFTTAIGCGDDKSMVDPTPDAAVDAAGDAAAFVPPAPFAIPISTAGPDLLMAAAPGPSGTFYAAGYASATVTGTKEVIVTKLTASGAMDTTFGGGDGIASTGVAFRGSTDEIDIAVQSTGKIIVTATIANTADSNDRDVAVIRLNADGALDNTFGSVGVLTLNLNTATNDSSNMLKGPDAARAVTVGANDVIYVHAMQRAEGFIGSTANPRLDTDFALVRLTAEGVPDTAFGGGDGKFLLDLQETNANAKGLVLLADGSIVGTGYAATPGFGAGVQPVLYKLTPAGELVTAFATGGLFHEAVLGEQLEVYAAALSGDGLVTASYGRDPGAANDWYIMRINATTGMRDSTFGGAPKGLVRVDPSGMNLGSNCRNAIAMPGGRVALFGSTGPADMPSQDAVFAVLAPNGSFDAQFGGKAHVLKLGADGNDQFWGAAVNAGKTLFVGWKGGGATQTDTENDDAYGLLVTTP